jgi:hypothetical protein
MVRGYILPVAQTMKLVIGKKERLEAKAAAEITPAPGRARKGWLHEG